MNQCYKCRNFQRYYIKGTKMYNMTKIGRCCIKNETVSNTDCCGEFKIKVRYKPGCELPFLQLNDLLTEIAEIRKYLEDKNDDEEQEV